MVATFATNANNLAFNLMKQIIPRKTNSKQWCINRVNQYYAFGQLTDEQYAELMELIEQTYPEVA